MADLQGGWVPETQAEWELINDLNAVTVVAYEDGVAQEDIVSALTYMATSVVTSDPQKATQSDPEPEPISIEESEGSEELDECPYCGEVIEEVQAFLGGNTIVVPCGCKGHVDDFPGRFD